MSRLPLLQNVELFLPFIKLSVLRLSCVLISLQLFPPHPFPIKSLFYKYHHLLAWNSSLFSLVRLFDSRSPTHDQRLGQANSAAPVDKQLRRWDGEAMCNTSFLFVAIILTWSCFSAGCSFSTHRHALNPSVHSNLPRDVMRSASNLTWRTFPHSLPPLKILPIFWSGKLLRKGYKQLISYLL